jgi:hypothetical protein
MLRHLSLRKNKIHLLNLIKFICQTELLNQLDGPKFETFAFVFDSLFAFRV